MKYSATRVIFAVAMPSATMVREGSQVDISDPGSQAGGNQQHHQNLYVGSDGIDVCVLVRITHDYFPRWRSIRVEKREQENPDDIDEVPIEPSPRQPGCKVGRREPAFVGLHDEGKQRYLRR